MVDPPCGKVEQRCPIAVITRKELVASLTRQNHLHVSLCELRHEVEGDAGRVSERFVLVPDQMREGRREISMVQP